MLNICIRFHTNISEDFKGFHSSDTIFVLKFTNEYNSVKNVSEVLVYVFCTPSYDDIYLY